MVNPALGGSFSPIPIEIPTACKRKRPTLNSPTETDPHLRKKANRSISNKTTFSWPESLWPERLSSGRSIPKRLTVEKTSGDSGRDAFISSWEQAKIVEKHRTISFLAEMCAILDSGKEALKIDTFFKVIYKKQFRGKSDVQSLPLLHMAALSDLRASVQYLLDEVDGNINATDEKGLTALHRCVDAGTDVETIRFLLKNQADLSYRDDFGMTALHRAAYRGNWQMVEALLDHEDRYINVQDRFGRTALHCAVLGERRGWRWGVWEPDPGSAQSLATVAKPKRWNFVVGCFQDTVRILLNQPIRTDLKDALGRTAFQLAKDLGREQIFETSSH